MVVIYFTISVLQYFRNLNRHPMLRLLLDCVLGVRDWTQKLESRKAEIEVLLQPFDIKAQKPGSRGGPRA